MRQREPVGASDCGPSALAVLMLACSLGPFAALASLSVSASTVPSEERSISSAAEFKNELRRMEAAHGLELQEMRDAYEDRLASLRQELATCGCETPSIGAVVSPNDSDSSKGVKGTEVQPVSTAQLPKEANEPWLVADDPLLTARRSGALVCGVTCATGLSLASSMFGLTCQNTYGDFVARTGACSTSPLLPPLMMMAVPNGPNLAGGFCPEQPPAGFTAQSLAMEFCPDQCRPQCSTKDEARFTALLDKATLADRTTIAPLLLAATPGLVATIPCLETKGYTVQSILETVAYVCGEQCIVDALHIYAQQTIIAQPTLPDLARRLRIDQASTFMVKAGLREPIGIVDSGASAIVWAGHRKCLDVSGGTVSDRASVRIAPCKPLSPAETMQFIFDTGASFPCFFRVCQYAPEC